MQSASQSNSKTKLWAARILSGIAVVFLLFDSTIHLMVIQPVVDSFGQLGIPVNLSVTIGIIELICLVLYVIPRTSVFGAILLTGYLGGAIAIQVRIAAPLFSTALFPIYIGVMAWGGLYLRDGLLMTIIPLRKAN
jgi:DoxX-like family